MAEATQVRGNFLRITDMRFRPANISVAASRTTVRRRIVEPWGPGLLRKGPNRAQATALTRRPAAFFIQCAGGN